MRAATGILVAVLAVGSAAAQVNWDAWAPREEREVAYPRILVEPGEVAADWIPVDARGDSAFRAGHLPGSRHLDVRGFLVDAPRLAGELGRRGIPDHGTLVAITDGGDPGAAGRLLWLLEFAGHPDVRVLAGGLEAWPGPRETGAPAVRETRFAADPRDSLLATRRELRRTFGTPGTTVLDWRTPPRWGEGHVPHSLPVPWEGLLEAGFDGEALRDRLSRFGPREREYLSLEDRFVILGDDRAGEAPGSAYLLLRLAGVERVAVFPGGLREWRGAGEPVTRIVGTETVRGRMESGEPMLLLDLRGGRDHALGHLPGALALPMHRFAGDLGPLVAEHAPGIDRSTTPVVCYCYGVTCTRSRNGTTAAARAGFRVLWWYRGGIQAWKEAGLPVERE